MGRVDLRKSEIAGPSGLASAFDAVLSPLDALRTRVFVGAQRVPVLGPLLARRDRRVALQACLGVLVTLALTLRAPGLLFVWGPALFGIAHIGSDIRYLVLRRDIGRALTAGVFLVGGALIAGRIVTFFAPRLLAIGAIEVAVGWGSAAACALVAAFVSRAWLRGALVFGAAAAVAIVATRHAALAQALFAYGHNIVAIGVWAFFFRRRLVFALPVLALATVGAAFLASHAGVAAAHLASAWDLRMVSEALAAAPRGTSQHTMVGIGLSYVFLQSIHYSVWLAWVPQEDLKSEGTTSFRQTLRGLVRDFTPIGLAVIALLAALVVAGSFVSVHRTRLLYISLASFHGYLEVAMLAYFVVRGRLAESVAR